MKAIFLLSEKHSHVYFMILNFVFSSKRLIKYRKKRERELEM